MKRLALIIHLAVCIALAVSLFWNVKQTRDSRAYSAQSYINGFIDGGQYVVGEIEYALLKRELIEEQRAHTAEERL